MSRHASHFFTAQAINAISNQQDTHQNDVAALISMIAIRNTNHDSYSADILFVILIVTYTESFCTHGWTAYSCGWRAERSEY